MATRENQTLQISLMVFAILLVVFAVLTYYFWKTGDDLSKRVVELQDKQSKNKTDFLEKQNETNQYKIFMGFKEQDGAGEIKTAFDKDMADFGGTFNNEGEQNYRNILAVSSAELAKANTREAKANEGKKELEGRLLALEAQHAAQIKEHEGEAVAAKKDLAAQTAFFEADRQKFKVREKELANEQETSRDGYEKQSADKDGKITLLAKDLTAVEKQRDRLLVELKQGQPEPQFEVADGNVTWVSQRRRILWIDLGHADQLRPQLTFSIVAEGQPISTRDTSAGQGGKSISTAKPGEKGKIEITRILDSHLAEARILSDDLVDPIMPGDQVYSPSWHRGKQTHFALGGVVDLDGDGKSDLARAIDIIRINGGVIDEYVSDEGKLRFDLGKNDKGIGIDTRFLVLGTTPDPTSDTNRAIHDQTGDLRKRAAKLGIDEISLQKFLNLMGWQSGERTVPLGRASREKDFLPKPEGGIQRTDAGGSTSGLFRKRSPKSPY